MKRKGDLYTVHYSFFGVSIFLLQVVKQRVIFDEAVSLLANGKE